MKPEYEPAEHLSRQIGALLSQTRRVCDSDPEMCEAAEMVYIGDVYALREMLQDSDSGWGQRHYVADSGDDPM